MSKSKSHIPLSEQILEEACGWFIDFNEGELDARGREQFNQWLHRSPEHVRAYVEIAAAWEDSSRINHRQAVDLEALIAQISTTGNVVALNAHATRPVHNEPSSESSPSASRRMHKGWMRLSRIFPAVAAAVALASMGIWLYDQRNTYATDIGEQRSIVLADGSTVELNARSRLRVRFSRHEREVDLLEGQALFQVDKDPVRPFVVQTSGARVRAIGTQFDVYRKASGTVVTVIEGRVVVTPAAAAPTASSNVSSDPQERTKDTLHDSSATGDFLSAGEQLTVAPRIASHPVHADVAAVTAWTQRKLIFVETPLMEVVTEFNRYNTRQIIIDDPSLAQFHIRGNFQATDPQRFIQFLRDRFDVDVSSQGGQMRISRK
jgi:transmembrane sensor